MKTKTARRWMRRNAWKLAQLRTETKFPGRWPKKIRFQYALCSMIVKPA